MNTTRIHTLLLCLAVMAGTSAAFTARAAEEQQAPAQPADQTPVAAEQPVTNALVPATVPVKLDGIYFNFRGAPLETVLKDADLVAIRVVATGGG